MNIERSIGAGPRRSADKACAVISDFIVEIAKGREYPDLAGIRAGFQKISPTLSVMLTTRSLAEPAISVRMPEFQVQIRVGYGPDEEDELSVPDLTLLDKLAESDPIQVVLHSTGTVHQSLQERLHVASSKHIAFTLAPPIQSQPPIPVPVPPRIPEPTPRQDLVQEPALDSESGPGLPPAGVPEDYPVPDVGAEPSADSFRHAEGEEPVIPLDSTDEPDSRGFLGHPAIDD